MMARLIMFGSLREERVDATRVYELEGMSRWWTVFFLLVVLAIPLIGLRLSVGKLVREEERVVRGQLRDGLFREMESFQDDLRLPSVITQEMAAFEGTFTDPGRNALPRLRSDKGFLLSAPDRMPPALHRFAARRGLPPPVLVISGSGERFDRISVAADPRVFSGMAVPSRKAARDILTGIHSEAADRADLLPEAERQRRQKTLQNHLGTLFGKYRPSVLTAGSCQECVATKLGNRSLLLFSRNILGPDQGTFGTGFAYLAVFAASDFADTWVFRRAACLSRDSECERGIRFLPKRMRTRFFDRAAAVDMAQMMSYETMRQFPDLMRKLARGTGFRIPHLVLRSKEQPPLESVSRFLPWLNGGLLACFGACLCILLGWVNLLCVRVSLRYKFAGVMFFIVFVPLGAFLLLSAASRSFQIRIETSRVRDGMEQKLGMFEQSFFSLEREMQTRVLAISQTLAGLDAKDPRFLEVLRRIGDWNVCNWGVCLTGEGLLRRFVLEPYSPLLERRRKFDEEVQSGAGFALRNVLNKVLPLDRQILEVFELGEGGKKRPVKSAFNLGSLDFGGFRSHAALEGTLLRMSLPFQADGFAAFSFIPRAPNVPIVDSPRGMFLLMLSAQRLAKLFARMILESGQQMAEETPIFRISYYLMQFDPRTRALARSGVLPHPPPPWVLDEAQRALHFGPARTVARSDARMVSARVFNSVPCLAVGVAELKPFARIEDVGIPLPIMVVYSLGLLLLLSRFLAEILVEPFGTVIAAFRDIRAERYALRLNPATRDEFSVLAGSVNRMAQALLERQRMERFVSDRVVELSRTSGDGGAATGEEVEGSILVSDIRGFTTIAETYPAEEVVAMLNEYFSEMENAIREQGGLIDKFIGDAIIAVFFPVPGGEDCAIRACRAGLVMRTTLAALNQERRGRGHFEIDNGVSVATGKFVSGTVRSGTKRWELGIYGETVHLAGELEPLTKLAVSSRVVVCPETASRVRGTFSLSGLAGPGDGKDLTGRAFEIGPVST